jgi:putative sigma-54 modulation protein
LEINVTGRGEDVTAAMKQKAVEKVAKTGRFFDRITWVEVTLDMQQKARGSVEVTAGLPQGSTIVGKADGADVYAAIDVAVDKIVKQLRRHKERLKDRRTRRPGPSGGEGAGGD